MSIKGKQKLYNKVVPTSIVKSKGNYSARNTDIEARHDCMTARYYYYAVLLRKRYDDALEALEREWFLRPNQITTCLLKREELLLDLTDNKTTPKELKEMYPWFDWSL